MKNIFLRIKAFGLVRTATILINGGFVVFILLAHLWTPKGDFVHLYTAYQILPSSPWILSLPIIGLAVWPILIKEDLYSKFKNRVIVLIHGIVFAALFFLTNAFLMEASDKAPTPSNLAMTGIILFPLALVTVSALALRKRKEKVIDLPAPTRGRPVAYGTNPLTALAAGIWSLRKNASIFAVLVLVIVAAIATPGILKTYLGTSFYHKDIALTLSVGLGLFLLSYIAQVFVLIVAVATASNERITLRQLVRRHWKLVLSFLALQLLMTLFISLGLLLFIIPGIILSFRYALAPYILVERKISPMAALKYSSELMKRNSMQIVGIGIVILAVILIQAALQLWSPIIGAAIGGAILAIVSAGYQVYCTKLYRSLEEAKREGYKGLKAHWLNGVMLVAAGLLTLVIWFGALVWLSISGHGSGVTYDTPCFRVQLPSVYKIDKQSACHLHATTRYTVLDYASIDDSATTIDELIAHQRQALYPEGHYRLLPGIGESEDQVDGENAKSYSFYDSSSNTTVNVTFVHTHRTTIIEGKQIRNYVLFNGSPAETAKDFSLGEFTNATIILGNTIKWPPYGGTEYQQQMIAAQAAYNSKNFRADIEHAKSAAAAADNDAARAMAFEWVGLGHVGLSDEPSAQTAFEEAVLLDPTYTDALNSLAGIRYDHGDYAAAIKLAMKIVQLDETYGDAFNMLALCYDAQGNKTEAVKNIQKAIRLDPKNQVYLDNAAQMNTQIGAPVRNPI